MIGPGDERARGGPPGFHDSVLVEFCDGERELFGLLRIARVPDAGRTELLAIMFSGADPVLSTAESGLPLVPDWERVEAGGGRFEVVAPLERWRASYASPAAAFDLELTAASAPVDFDEPPAAELARASGTHGYEQLCGVRGTAQVGGQEMQLEGVGRRVHSWGRSEPGSVAAARSVFAFAEGSGMTVAAIRPAGSADHGHELIAGHLLRGATEPLALEQVRLSTVYDRSGRPREAGLELLAPGEEMPRRVAGEATCGISIESTEAITWLAFFRWSFEGVPGLGSYQLHRRK
jgi:hypothetical protein